MPEFVKIKTDSMKFRAAKFLTFFQTISLVWTFVGCAFVCLEKDDCNEDLNVSAGISVSLTHSSQEDICPIQASAKTTAPEKIVFKSGFTVFLAEIFTPFSTLEILPDISGMETKFYRPPKIISQNKLPFVLRI